MMFEPALQHSSWKQHASQHRSTLALQQQKGVTLGLVNMNMNHNCVKMFMTKAPVQHQLNMIALSSNPPTTRAVGGADIHNTWKG